MYLCDIKILIMYLINDLLESLRSFFQKHNRGFITGEEYNRAINFVQSQIIREAFNGLNIIKNKKKIGRVNSNDCDKEKFYKEVIRPFLANQELVYNGDGFDYPDDYSLCESIFYNDREVEQLNDNERMFIHLEETLPTENYPVYLDHSNEIEVLPDTIEDSVVMYYYRQPKTPKWTYTVVSGEALFNPSAPDFQDVELPYSIFDEILRKLELYFSGQLKQPDVAQSRQYEENRSEQLKNNE